jgi:hypothetical protein
MSCEILGYKNILVPLKISENLKPVPNSKIVQ